MRQPSRYMPQWKREQATTTVWLLRAFFVILLAALCYSTPKGFFILIGLASVVTIFALLDQKKLIKRLNTREDVSICTFARSFDCRNVDTWIIRATYEEIQRYLDPKTLPPIKTSDRLWEDLHIEADDVEYIGVAVAKRIGYDLRDTKSNPLYDGVKTVEDLVLFLTNQPRIAA